MRIPVIYKDHDFTAVADGAGLDVETNGTLSDYTMALGSELWSAIYKTRLSLFPKAEEYDTTSSELIECLKTLKLI
jgi:hypothetical protein